MGTLFLALAAFVGGGIWYNVRFKSPKRKAMRKRMERRKAMGLK